MRAQNHHRRFRGMSALCLLGAFATGCATAKPQPPCGVDLPHELQKVSHPTYMIEPPDIIQVDLVTAVPKPPYKIKPLDVIGLLVVGTTAEYPISGAFTVEPDGTVNLGTPYGNLKVSGMTIEEINKAAAVYLMKFVKSPMVNASLVQTRGVQQIRGPHLVRADGTVSLGTYGLVRVVGMSQMEAKKAIEEHLQTYFQEPEVALDIVGYNSKIYYVVFDYGGAGQQVVRVPITGNETVLDGIAQLNGLPTVADSRRIWLSRPRPDNSAPTVLPVDWKGIIETGDTRTNYQILPGDRLVVKAYPLVEDDNKLARVIAPIERILGITLLGSSTVNSIRTNPNQNGGNNNGQ